jgi:hypothetical protein
MQLERLVEGPLVRQSYALRAWGPVATLDIARHYDENVTIERGDGMGADDDIRHLREQVVALQERNAPGDREQARHLLNQRFDRVIETAV